MSNPVGQVIDRLLASWDEWAAEAGQAAQVEQDGGAYRAVMAGHLRRALAPLVLEVPSGSLPAGFVPLATHAERVALRPGDVALVETDAGALEEFVVRHPAWQTYGDRWLIGLKGVSGGYDLSRVRGKAVKL